MRHGTKQNKRHTYRGMRVDVSAQRGEATVTTIVSVDGGILPATQRAATIRPAGYEWGTAGDGEALAHALLAYEFGIDIADLHYEDFARMIVEHLPDAPARGPAWTMNSDELRGWLKEHSA